MDFYHYTYTPPPDIIIGVLECTPDGFWYNHLRRQYIHVGGSPDNSIWCGAYSFVVHNTPNKTDWNLGAKYTPDAFWFKQPWGYSNFYPWAGGSVFRGAGTEGCWNLNMMMARDAVWATIWEIGAPDGSWWYPSLTVVGTYRRVGGSTGNKSWAGVFTYMDTGINEKKWDEGASQPTTKPDVFWFPNVIAKAYILTGCSVIASRIAFRGCGSSSTDFNSGILRTNSEIGAPDAIWWDRTTGDICYGAAGRNCAESGFRMAGFHATAMNHRGAYKDWLVGDFQMDSGGRK